MTLSCTYNGAALTQKFAPSGIQITHRADGDPSQGGIPIEDPAAALTMVGWKPFTVVESACSQPRLFTGFTMQRDIGRSLDEGLFVGEDARLQDLTVTDLNAIFGFRVITRTGTGGGNRPAETWAARLTWILESEYLNEWISADQTWVVTNTTMMEETDYRGSYAASVMEDLVDRSGGAYIYFAFYDTTAHEIRLFFDNDVETTGLSAISISNDWDDVDNDYVFAPDSVSKLAREADQVYSDVVVTYNEGTQKVYRYRPHTAADYVRRGTEIQRPYTKGLATATAQGEKFLDKHAEETDRITCSIQVPASRVGLIEAGQGMTVRFTHLPGYETDTTMRVVSYSPRPTNDLATHYDVALELVNPVVVVGPCVLEGPTPSGYYPNVLDDSFVDTGNVIYSHAGMSLPHVPTVGWSQEWYFGPNNTADASVPSGSIDSPIGDSTNSGELYVVGPGTMTIYMRLDSQGSVARDIRVRLLWSDIVFPYEGDISEFYQSANSDITVVIPDDGYCYHIVRLSDLDPSISTWYGFGGFTWVSGVAADVVVELPPAPGATTTHTTDPTVTDDAAAGYTVGSIWLNETSGEAFILADSTTGAAVWVSITATGAVYAPTTADYLVGTAQAGLSAEIVVGTTPGGELGGTWASPTVDATHSGSAHLALGSTSSTAAAGDHTHAVGGAVGPILITDTPSTPLVFADLIQNEAEDDLVYADI